MNVSYCVVPHRVHRQQFIINSSTLSVLKLLLFLEFLRQDKPRQVVDLTKDKIRDKKNQMMDKWSTWPKQWPVRAFLEQRATEVTLAWRTREQPSELPNSVILVIHISVFVCNREIQCSYVLIMIVTASLMIMCYFAATLGLSVIISISASKRSLDNILRKCN